MLHWLCLVGFQLGHHVTYVNILVGQIRAYSSRILIHKLAEIIRPQEMSVCLVILLLQQLQNYGVVVGGSSAEFNELIHRQTQVELLHLSMDTSILHSFLI